MLVQLLVKTDVHGYALHAGPATTYIHGSEPFFYPRGLFILRRTRKHKAANLFFTHWVIFILRLQDTKDRHTNSHNDKDSHTNSHGREPFFLPSGLFFILRHRRLQSLPIMTTANTLVSDSKRQPMTQPSSTPAPPEQLRHTSCLFVPSHRFLVEGCRSLAHGAGLRWLSDPSQEGQRPGCVATREHHA